MALIAMALCEHGMEGSRSFRGFDGVGFVPSLAWSFRAGAVDELPPIVPPRRYRRDSADPVPRVCLDNWASSQVLINSPSFLVLSIARYGHIAYIRFEHLTLHLKVYDTEQTDVVKLMYWLKTKSLGPNPRWSCRLLK